MPKSLITVVFDYRSEDRFTVKFASLEDAYFTTVSAISYNLLDVNSPLIIKQKDHRDIIFGDFHFFQLWYYSLCSSKPEKSLINLINKFANAKYPYTDED